MTDPGVAPLVERLFRRSAARMVAGLTRTLGAEHLELAEEAVQDALVKALQTWPWRGVPRRPEAWLFRVARNRALDRLRRSGRWQAEPPGGDATPLVDALAASPAPTPGGPMADDELAMVFMCCHPSLPPDGRVALTLKVVGGLSVEEIAAAHLAEPAAVAQRIVRAKRRLRRAGASLALPDGADLPARLDAVLRTLYLLFNEGYAASGGDALVRRELCREAIRLSGGVADHPATADPAADALCALLLLQASRLPAREGPGGDVVVLERQDRALWDRDLIARGMERLRRSARGDVLSPYHFEAGIAACHAGAPDAGATDWVTILSYYDGLLEVAPSPVAALNRSVAVAMVEGAEAGLRALDGVAEAPELRRYPLLPATRGDLLERAGRPGEAAVHFRRALMLTRSEPLRRFLAARADAAEAGA